jgi:AcrR family transcriptional regulator
MLDSRRKVFIVGDMEMSEDPRRPRGRPRGFDRGAALDAAMRLFWAQGFDRTSIHDLTAAMGVNPPSLYAAFGDKRRLYCEALARYQALVGGCVTEPLAGGGSAREAVADMLATAARVYADPAHPAGCMILHAAAEAGDDDLADRLAGARRRLAEQIAERVAGEPGGGDRADAGAAAELGRFFAAVLQGMSSLARDGASVVELEAVAKRAMAAWPADRAGEPRRPATGDRWGAAAGPEVGGDR